MAPNLFGSDVGIVGGDRDGELGAALGRRGAKVRSGSLRSLPHREGPTESKVILIYTQFYILM